MTEGAIPGTARRGAARRRPGPRAGCAGAGALSRASRASGAGRAAGTGAAGTRGSPRTAPGERKQRCGHARPGSPRSSTHRRMRCEVMCPECRERGGAGAPHFPPGAVRGRDPGGTRAGFR
ncbi:hypothetical protein SGM_3429 [Streptomyces griseoaurantiacus M045]|uniref:Uncharacterized protein n=1 Tax=Streptomyces griseoaurantiacus M045 TaxID=996637 RepID=F3NJW5_9ACTN|nr:hypothetical protein SGM_3429 [Streptomyces griseoaurantiacus M045]